MDDLPHSILYILSCRLSMPCITTNDTPHNNNTTNNTHGTLLITNRAEPPHSLLTQAIVPHTPHNIPQPTPTASIPNSPAAALIAITSTAAATTTSTFTTLTTTIYNATYTTTPPSTQLLTQTSPSTPNTVTLLAKNIEVEINQNTTPSNTPPTPNKNTSNTSHKQINDAPSIAQTKTITINNNEDTTFNNTNNNQQNKTNQKLNNTFTTINDTTNKPNLTDMQVVIPNPTDKNNKIENDKDNKDNKCTSEKISKESTTKQTHPVDC